MLAALVSFLLAGVIFVTSVIQELDLDKISDSAPPRMKDRENDDTIDQGVLLEKKMLGLYVAWSDAPQGINQFISSHKDKIDSRKNDLFFKESVALPELKRNDCKMIYCLQSKLAFPEIPSLLWRGLIGIEDYRFLDHVGVDPRSLLRALWHDIKVRRLEQGGSTLTQQLAKNLFYSNEKKFSRKIKEMIASTYIEAKFGKEDILQAYFNEVEWGSLQGIKIKGVAAASLFYFQKPHSNLTPFEVSLLIGLLKGPYFYSPVNHPERLRKRVKVVFDKLLELNLFPDEANYWDDKRWNDWVEKLKSFSQSTSLRSLYILSEKKREEQKYSNFVLINEVGLLNKELKAKYKKSDFAIKVIKFNLAKNDLVETFRHYSKFERNLDKAITEEHHQVGSTLKPIIYGLLNGEGLLLSEEVKTAPLTMNLLSGPWSPRESHGNLPEKVTYREALLQSLNRPVIRAVQTYGFNEFEKIFSYSIPRLKVPLAEFPAQLLGSVELSVKELGHAYARFLQFACWKGVGYQVLETLSDPRFTTIKYRVGEKLGQMKFFGKTGTSNNGYDNWFVGFDGRELLITWVGLEGDRTKNKEFRLFGSNTAFLIYKSYYENRGKLFNEMACQEE